MAIFKSVIVAEGNCRFVWKNGAYADLTAVFSKYGLTSLGSPKIENAEFSEDGMYMYFDSSKERAIFFGAHTFEPYDNGRYRLDLKNFIITRVS